MIRAVLFDVGETLVEEVDDAERPLDQLSLVPFPDAVATLQQLKAGGYLLAVISNTSRSGEREMDIALEAIRLRQYFDLIVTSFGLGIAKPSPEIFEFALGRLGCPASEAAMVGDDIRKDIEGAAGAGLWTILVRRGWKSEVAVSVVPTFTVDSLIEVPPLLARLPYAAG